MVPILRTGCRYRLGHHWQRGTHLPFPGRFNFRILASLGLPGGGFPEMGSGLLRYASHGFERSASTGTMDLNPGTARLDSRLPDH